MASNNVALKALQDIEQIIHDYLPPAREITAQEALEEIIAVMDRSSVMRLTQKAQKRPADIRPSHSQYEH